ncbi:superfamily II DNA and RNA helicase, partial [human gut metagenome]
RVETAIEALNISINEYGKVNIPFILSIYIPDISGEVGKMWRVVKLKEKIN